MQLIQFLPSSGTSCALKATSPRVGQAKATIAAGTGATGASLFTPLTTGAVPYAAGQISNPGCAELLLTIFYLNGADCDNCTADTIGSEKIDVIVPAKSVMPLPDGLITEISYLTGSTDAAGVFTASNVSAAQTINWYSYYTPCCDQVLVP